MRKLKLALDDLAVQSFTTAAPRVGVGTVRGRAEETWTDCPPGCITDIRTDNQSECFPEQCGPGTVDTE